MENSGNQTAYKRRSRRDRRIDDMALKTGEIPQITAAQNTESTVVASAVAFQSEIIGEENQNCGEKNLKNTKRQRRHSPQKQSRKNRVRELSGAEQLKAKLPLIIAVLLGASLVTGIGFWIDYSQNQLELSTDMKNSIQITGKLGANPVLILKNSMPFTVRKEQVLIAGKGAVLKPNDDVFLKISVFNGNNGTLLNKNGLPRQIVGKNNPDFLGQDLFETVKNKRIYSRLLIKRPVRANGQLGYMEIDVVDILPAVVKTAEIPKELPVSYSQEGELPQINDANFSFTSSQIFIIKHGSGKQIAADSKVITQVGIWHSGISGPVTYSWNQEGPKILDLAKSYRSVAKQLPDIREGSRILLTIPAEDADGEASVVVVLDILEIANP